MDFMAMGKMVAKSFQTIHYNQYISSSLQSKKLTVTKVLPKQYKSLSDYLKNHIFKNGSVSSFDVNIYKLVFRFFL